MCVLFKAEYIFLPSIHIKMVFFLQKFKDICIIVWTGEMYDTRNPLRNMI